MTRSPTPARGGAANDGARDDRCDQGALPGLIGVMIFGLTLPATPIAVAELPVVFVALGRAGMAAALAGAVPRVGRRAPVTRG